MFELLSSFVTAMNNLVWSTPMILLCVGAGIFFTLRMGFLQIRHFPEMWRLLMESDRSESGVTPFQAFATTVGGRVGVGSIGGVATAICLGGPGAIFWMWAIALLGMSTAFVESALGQAYKTKVYGEYVGGPQYYIERALGWKGYGMAYAVVAFLALGVLCPGAQTYSIVTSMQSAFGIDVFVTGGVVCFLLALIIFGGIKRIGKTAEVLAPFMSMAFILMALLVCALNFDRIPSMIALIFKSAFGAEQAFSGIVGSAISWGVKRGIFSNEAGDGTGALVSSAAVGSHPAKQGLIQALSIFITTIVVGTATSFMILVTGAYNVSDGAGGMIVENLPGIEYGILYTQEAINRSLGGFGNVFVAVSVFLFAFTSLMAFCYMAESNMSYIFPNSKAGRFVTRILFLIFTFFGVVNTGEMIWTWGDLGVGMMVWLNVIAILLLSNQGVKILRDYEDQKRRGLDPVFDPALLGIRNDDGIWNER
ncbi:alanine/glycine:cation symporter family protein [Fretibacterium sp. OH1220_COT-178]|uniref:alanine/glycine:cation symporter family protein n=1 Tax=Fretibacterium sp. OH1220_COT-178 TaxID=2491047 RepID=UPI000F5DD5B4|nr:alanine/glycine:cation symporter family protein [Fretibacterium sp. OH1220_COT-178]RRD63219.1 alanine:cation symporter family protein [Fretibacterium sp. OH1220_COT-178]